MGVGGFTCLNGSIFLLSFHQCIFYLFKVYCFLRNLIFILLFVVQEASKRLIDYISFRIPDDSFSNLTNCIGMARGLMHDLGSIEKGFTSLEAVLLCIPGGYHCVDLSLYKVSIKKFPILMLLCFLNRVILTHRC